MVVTPGAELTAELLAPFLPEAADVFAAATFGSVLASVFSPDRSEPAGSDLTGDSEADFVAASAGTILIGVNRFCSICDIAPARSFAVTTPSTGFPVESLAV